MMGQAILDGFERGFNMMERHNARVGRDERTARLDEQNENRYNDTVDYRKQTAENTANYRKQESTAKSKHRQWQVNQAEEQKQWALISPQMENIHNEYFKTGELPEQAAKFFEENPQYADYNPSTYQDPNFRKAAKDLQAKTTEIFKSKKLHQFKDPAYIKSFNDAFQSKIQQGVGEDDIPRNAKITSKSVAELIPTRDGKVSIGLKVTYQPNDGGASYSEIQPMTKGKTSDQEDPVNEWGLPEIMSAINTRASMADMAENGEHYLNRSGNTLKAMGFGGAKDKKAYRNELSSIEKDLAKAITDIQGDSSYMDEASRTAAINGVKATFERRRKSTNKAYGIEDEKSTTHQPDPLGLLGDGDNGPSNDPLGLLGGGTTNQPTQEVVNKTEEQPVIAKTKEPKITRPKEPEVDTSNWASPPQDFMDASGLNAIGRTAKSGFNGVIDWNSRKKAESRFASKYGRVPSELELQEFLASEA